MDHAYLYRTLLERCRAALTEYQASRDFEALIASLEAVMTEAEVQMEEEEKYREAQCDDAQRSFLKAVQSDPEPIPTLEALGEQMMIAERAYLGCITRSSIAIPLGMKVAFDIEAERAWRAYWAAKNAYETAIREASNA